MGKGKLRRMLRREAKILARTKDLPVKKNSSKAVSVREKIKKLEASSRLTFDPVEIDRKQAEREEGLDKIFSD